MKSGSSGSEPATPSGADGGEALLGRVLDDRYRIEAVLGTGGVGVVYRGLHTALARPVAIKVLHGYFVDRDDLRQRFEREAKVLSALAHPHIVAITDYGLAEGMPYLVMELLEGQTLSDLIRSDSKLSPDAALEIARGILRGLAFAHAHGVLHRDLKPANVFLQRLPDDPYHVKLLDFGLAKIVEAESDEVSELTLTRTGAVLGTPAYMSPEQASGATVDARTDVYSAGCVLFELLAGRPPFVSDTRPDLIRQHLLSDVPALADVRRGLEPTPELSALVARALRKDPRQRFADGSEMLSALDALPRPAVLRSPATGKGRARRASPPSRSDGSDLPTVSANAPTPPPRSPAAHPGPMPTAPGRSETGRQPLRWMGVGAVVIGLVVVGVGALLAWRSASPASSTQLDDLKGPVQEIPFVAGPGRRPTRASSPPSTKPSRPVSKGRAEENPAAAEPVPAAPGLAAQDTATHDETGASSPEDEGSGEPSPTTASETEAAPREAPRYLLAGALPRSLRPYWGRVRRGRPLTRAQQKHLRTIQQRRGDDPRPSLLLGHDFAVRGWLSDAITRYEVAYRMDPASRGDPRMLRNMVDMATVDPVAGRAAALVLEIYGAEALPAVERALRKDKDPVHAARLKALERRLQP